MEKYEEVDIDAEIEKQKRNDPKFCEMWEASREQYRLMGEIIALQKHLSISQKLQIAISPSKRRAFARFNQHSHNPSLRMTCDVLDAMDYRMEIRKK